MKFHIWSPNEVIIMLLGGCNGCGLLISHRWKLLLLLKVDIVLTEVLIDSCLFDNKILLLQEVEVDVKNDFSVRD